MFIAPVTGIFRILDVGLGLSTLLYIGQMGIYGYGGGYFTFMRFRQWVEAKDRGDSDQLRKTAKDHLTNIMGEVKK